MDTHAAAHALQLGPHPRGAGGALSSGADPEHPHPWGEAGSRALGHTRKGAAWPSAGEETKSCSGACRRTGDRQRALRLPPACRTAQVPARTWLLGNLSPPRIRGAAELRGPGAGPSAPDSVLPGRPRLRALAAGLCSQMPAGAPSVNRSTPNRGPPPSARTEPELPPAACGSHFNRHAAASGGTARDREIHAARDGGGQWFKDGRRSALPVKTWPHA